MIHLQIVMMAYIYDFANSVGDYAFSLQGVSESFHCGVPMAFGDMKGGRLDKEGDTDAFNFVALKDQVVSIKAAYVGKSSTYLCWKLYGPNGAFLD